MKPHLFNALFLALALPSAGSLFADDFRPIFDGKSLEGWKGKDMSYWSIEDDAITAQSSKDHPCTQNQFLVWQGGDVTDFEVKLKFRMAGNSGNSGVQFRSVITPEGLAVGYQADILPSGPHLGGVCDERGRELIAGNGQKSVIDADGKRTNTSLGGQATMRKPGEWNDYHITAQGNHITLRLNGRKSCELIDQQRGEFDLAGILAVQLRSGKPMKVQFKDIQLKQSGSPKPQQPAVLATGEQSLFDGKSLKGWSAPNMSYWSVRDGAITAQSTGNNPCKANQTLVWQGGEVADFDLKLKFRLGDNAGNSGVQFRSLVDAKGVARGYQADILPSGTHCGAIWDESTGRDMLARNGQKVVIDASGKRYESELGKTVALKSAGEWNDCHITAIGHQMIIRINGEVSAELIDSQTNEFELKGALGFQLRAGVPMTAQFKDIRLKAAR